MRHRLSILFSLSPSTVYTNDTIIATALFSDDDGHTVSGSYAWHVIDVATGTDTEVQNNSDNTLSGVTSFDRDDEVYVIVTPNDGIGDGTPQTSSSITISNTPPTGLTISSTPDPATTGQDDLVCSVGHPAATDEDGDSVAYTYVWTDDSGTVQQTTSTTATSDVFLASGTSDGTWTCEVTPNDGTDDGSSDSTVISVLTIAMRHCLEWKVCWFPVVIRTQMEQTTIWMSYWIHLPMVT